MDKERKINRLNELNKKILYEKKIILLHEEKLKLLEEKYKESSISELPILLFSVDTTWPMPDDYDEYEYQYLYYYPDFDTVKQLIGDYKRELLPNTIDLREQFKSIGIPKKLWTSIPFAKYKDEVDNSIIIIREVINDIFQNVSINSWKRLREYMIKNNSLINEQITNKITCKIKSKEKR